MVGGVARIPLVRRDGTIAAEAIVDDADYAALVGWTWRLSAGRAARREGALTILMHRELLGLEHGDGREGDHINRLPLDNRRENLRVVTHAQQQQNLPSMGGTSRYRGVSWFAETSKWRAAVVFQGRQHHLGLFVDEVEAARVAEAFRREHMTHAEPDPELARAEAA